MYCEKIKPLLYEYFDKVISDEDLKILVRHFEICESCSQELSDLEKLNILLKKENFELLERKYFYFENLRLTSTGNRFKKTRKLIPALRYSLSYAFIVFVGALLFVSNSFDNKVTDVTQISRAVPYNLNSENVFLGYDVSNGIGGSSVYELISDETIMNSDYLKNAYQLLIQQNESVIPGVPKYIDHNYDLQGLDQSDIEQIIKSLNNKEFI